MTDELERLRTAFVIDMTKRVIDADGKVVFSEIRFWSKVFPSDELRAMGFLDEGNTFTDALLDAQMEAVIRLPAELSADEKMGVIDTLHGACIADDVVGEDELAVVREAGQILGIAAEDVAARLEALSQG